MVVTQEHNQNISISRLNHDFNYVIFNAMESYSGVMPLHVVLEITVSTFEQDHITLPSLLNPPAIGLPTQ